MVVFPQAENTSFTRGRPPREMVIGQEPLVTGALMSPYKLKRLVPGLTGTAGLNVISRFAVGADAAVQSVHVVGTPCAIAEESVNSVATVFIMVSLCVIVVCCA
jgi:hypothetical protein